MKIHFKGFVGLQNQYYNIIKYKIFRTKFYMVEHPNSSKVGLHAAGGSTSLTRSYLKPPDTLVKLPNGETLIL